MIRRIFAFFLSMAMVVGMLPTAALADEVQVTPNVIAAFSDALTIDGKLSEPVWVTEGWLSDGTNTRNFGLMWDSAHLYIAVHVNSGDQALTVNLCGKDLTVALDALSCTGDLAASVTVAKDSAVELKIPFAALGDSVTSYNRKMNAALSVDDMDWNGTVQFVSDNRSTTPAFGSLTVVSPTGSPNLTNEASNGSYHLAYKYAEGTVASGTYRAGKIQMNMPILENATKNLVLDFDFNVKTMPEYPKEFTGNRCYIVRGFTMMVKDVTGKGYVLGITNTADGLYMAVGGQQNWMKLNKEMGETFHVRLERRPDLTLLVYVDGLLLGTFQNPFVDSAWGSATRIINCNLWVDDGYVVTEDGSMNVDFTFSNVRVGTGTTEELEGLSFEAIRGDNTSAAEVTSDLVLPETWSNGQLAVQEIIWKSSDTSVIANDGKVLLPNHDTVVTMTATLASNPAVSKDIQVTVPRMSMDAQLTTDAFAVDGVMDEGFWISSRDFGYTTGSNAPTGKLYAAWSKGVAYFAVSHADAETLELKLGDKTLVLNLKDGSFIGESYGAAAAVKNGVAELRVDMAALGQKIMDYGQIVEITATLSGAGGTAALENRAIGLVFTGNYISTVNLSGFTTIGAAVTDGKGVFSTEDTSNLVLYKSDIGAINHSENLLFSQRIQVTAMPESSGTITGNLSAYGYYFWLSDYLRTTNNTTIGNMLFGNIYNNGEGLILQIRQPGVSDSVYNAQAVALNKQVGDSFVLSILWTTANSAKIYVDGEYLTEFENVTVEAGGSGRDCMQLRYCNETAKQATISVSNVSITGVLYSSIKEELIREVILKDIDLTDIRNDISLPGTYESPYLGTLDLNWTSSDDTVLNPQTGKVNRPQGRVDAYANLTLTVNDIVIWSEEAVVSAMQEPMLNSPTTLGAGFTAEAVTVDGATTEVGWNINTKVGEKGKFGVQWDSVNLYLAATNGTNALHVTLNGVQIDLGSAVIANGVTEIAVPLSSLGVKVTDYGETITAKVTMDDATWEGVIVLTSTDWFATDSANPRIPSTLAGTAALGTDAKTANQGYEATDDGWHYYDYYSATSENPGKIRTYVIFWGTGATEEQQAVFAPLADQTVATYSEFDFYAAAMPVYSIGSATGWSSSYASYGFTWIVSGDDGDNKISDGVCMGIINTPDGLVLVAQGNSEDLTLKLNKQVGELFRLGTRWETNGDLTVFVDGVRVGVLKDVEKARSSYGDKSLVTNLIRNAPAQSRNDNFDIFISNIALGKAYGDSLIDAVTMDIILGENTDAYGITGNLNLITRIANAQLTEGIAVTWESSHPEIVAADGTVTPAEKGQLVTLTATGSGRSKTFEIYVKGTALNTDILVAENDIDTANGTAYPMDVYEFTFDTNHNSLVRDLGESRKVNVIALHDKDAFNRLNESVLTIWVSDDNKTYVQVDGFKILRDGKTTYLYDFEATGRYIKVHCTHYLGGEADFAGPLPEMMDAYYQEVFGAESEFAREDTYEVTNTQDFTVYDGAWRIENGAAADARVYLGNELLYHYVDGEDLVIRIPEMEAGATVVITVLSGCEDAMDISNKEYVYEVVYGTREAVVSSNSSRWLCELPDGRLIALCYSNAAGLTYCYSSDLGRTWTENTTIACSVDWLKSVGGLVYDPNNGRIVVEGYHNLGYVGTDYTQSNCKTRFIYSDDLGKTWNRSPDMTILGNAATYALSYSDPLIVSSYDGETGPNVDMVLNMAVQSRNNDGSFVCRVAYSCDAGLTWTLGADEINFTMGEGILAYEGGVSEGTIMENEDGILVLLARCQYDNANTFARSTSSDFGKTWSTPAEASTVYTVNTQPVFHQFGTSKLLVWPGNNVMGGNSYHRMPLNVAVSYDGLESFGNIQDLYSRLSLQGMTRPTGNQSTNPSVANIGDSLLVIWDNNFQNQILLRVDNFTDYFYRTKGAYDSFESASTKYEGWSTIIGNAVVTPEQAYRGDHSMKIVDASSVVRSVPYVQDGSVSFMLYLDDLSGTLQVELESAYSNEFGEAAPIALEIADGKLCGLELKQGWNEIIFNLTLTDSTATITVNGETAELDPDLNIGDYICYVEIGNGNTVAYVDEFMVQDLDAQEVPEAPEAPEVPQPELPKISGNLSLNETIDINFIIPASVDMTDAVLVVKNAATGEDVEYTILPGIGGTTVVRYSAKANHMTDEITVQVFDAEGNALTQKASMSVRKYAGIRLAVAEETEKMMLIRMLDYGALAQINSGVTTDLANSIVTDDLRSFANAYNWADAVQLEVPAGSGGVFKAGLALNETIDVTVYTAATNVAVGDKFVVKCNGEELTEDQYIVRLLDDGRYVIRYSVKSNEMSDEIYIAIVGEDNTVKAETTLGVRIYAQKFLAAVPTGNQAAMLLAMLDYGALAQIYAGNTENLANCFVTDTMRQVLISYPWP